MPEKRRQKHSINIDVRNYGNLSSRKKIKGQQTYKLDYLSVSLSHLTMRSKKATKIFLLLSLVPYREKKLIALGGKRVKI